MSRTITIELLGFSDPFVKPDGSVALPVHCSGQLVHWVATRKQWRAIAAAVTRGLAPQPYSHAHLIPPAADGPQVYPNPLPRGGVTLAARRAWWDAALADHDERGETPSATAHRLGINVGTVQAGLGFARTRLEAKAKRAPVLKPSGTIL